MRFPLLTRALLVSNPQLNSTRTTRPSRFSQVWEPSGRLQLWQTWEQQHSLHHRASWFPCFFRCVPFFFLSVFVFFFKEIHKISTPESPRNARRLPVGRALEPRRLHHPSERRHRRHHGLHGGDGRCVGGWIRFVFPWFFPCFFPLFFVFPWFFHIFVFFFSTFKFAERFWFLLMLFLFVFLLENMRKKLWFFFQQEMRARSELHITVLRSWGRCGLVWKKSPFGFWGWDFEFEVGKLM